MNDDFLNAMSRPRKALDYTLEEIEQAEKRMKKKDVWQPQIVNVYGDGEEPGCPTVSN